MTASAQAIDWTTRAALAAAEKKATSIVAIDVSDKLAITDVFLIMSGSNDRQVKAISDAVEAALDIIDVDPVRREGQQQGRWILLDYVDIVVHIQHEEERAFYDLERLWKDCPYIDLHLDVASDEAAQA